MVTSVNAAIRGRIGHGGDGDDVNWLHVLRPGTAKSIALARLATIARTQYRLPVVYAAGPCQKRPISTLSP
jgi:hypothetical protein